jgi:hypothetical protein
LFDRLKSVRRARSICCFFSHRFSLMCVSRL